MIHKDYLNEVLLNKLKNQRVYSHIWIPNSLLKMAQSKVIHFFEMHEGYYKMMIDERNKIDAFI